MEAYQEKLWGEPEKIEMGLKDPRPDLIEDTKVWQILLDCTLERNKRLAYILHGFRCGGLRLVKEDVGYVMQPEFKNQSIWTSPEEYSKDRAKWLLPHTQDIIQLLNKIKI